MVSPSHEEQSPLPSLSMDKQRNHMTERILRLTLEIIYLLTGENYGPVGKCKGPSAPNSPPCGLEGRTQKQTPILDPPSLSPTSERTNDKKILEVTKKMIELLTREVPIRCQDVAVYFSMEEWEYVEGHKELYKDVMMASQPALTSPDGSSNRNPPERCPHPLDSQDSTQEDQEIPQEDQTNGLIIVSVDCKEDPHEMGDEPCEEEDVPPEISTDGQDEEYKVEESPVILPVGQTKGYDLTGLFTTDLHPTFPSQHAPSAHRGRHRNVRQPPGRHMKPEVFKRFQCPDCDKFFTSRSKLLSHQTTHTGEKPYYCTECGKNFAQKSHLVSHQTVHTGKKPYSCPVCGKCFSRQSHLKDHEGIHAGVRPYSCPVCGKSFSSKSNQLRHQHIHSGDKPYSCSECGKSFIGRSNLVRHWTTHSGVKPFSCAHCEASFTCKSHLERHKLKHAGEKPYSCSDCGKCFTQKQNFMEHLQIHANKKPFSCPECGKSFAKKSNFMTHQRIHTNHKPFSCTECGKSFLWSSSLVCHRKTHSVDKETSYL